jgi:hypothetical protein
MSDLSYLFINDDYPPTEDYSKMIEDSKDYVYRITDEYNYKVLKDETIIQPGTRIVKSYKVGDTITMTKSTF